ncbi:MAG: helix-turn-helix domain-containing protein [Verrucomicrobiae bacterium]|nr:helix-turn-helix domain-containing protein [Verrucomicrobiae bacterium]
MRLIDTTDPGAHAGMRALVSSGIAEREIQLSEKFRIHLVGMYFARVGPEWDSGGKRQSDYLHHVDIGLSGHRSVVCGDTTYDLEPGQVWFFPGNTPVGRRCAGSSEVLFFKLNCEWLPGVDPLLDWEGRQPRLAGTVDVAEWRERLAREPEIGVSELLRLRGQLLGWLASALPELDEVISRHLVSHTQFTPVFDLIEARLGADLRLNQLAETNGTTTEAFSIAFSRSTGMSPKDYLTRRLNQEALQLVINTDLKIKEIAMRLRFNDEFYFSRFFKRLNGCSPVAYRKRLRESR